MQLYTNLILYHICKNLFQLIFTELRWSKRNIRSITFVKFSKSSTKLIRIQKKIYIFESKKHCRLL